MKYGLSTLLLLVTFVCAQAQSPIGIWKTIDDNSGEARSKIEIYEQNGKLFGKITDLLLKPNDTLCEACEGDKKNKLIVGMVIVENLEVYRDYWKNGTILDPESGSTYGCSIWFEEGKPDELQVRGKHWTGLYRTQVWYRIE
ncbi:MAG: DUF2147 domain-containing protein [Lewinella sp.]|jgi:uncharacterized protein (DUF2147 family)|uniref:DUF2147 domain-containing protein n=1 Tax=Lewinella sp. TaxID=2004506 RepID=UPI003D6ACA66